LPHRSKPNQPVKKRRPRLPLRRRHRRRPSLSWKRQPLPRNRWHHLQRRLKSRSRNRRLWHPSPRYRQKRRHTKSLYPAASCHPRFVCASRNSAQRHQLLRSRRRPHPAWHRAKRHVWNVRCHQLLRGRPSRRAVLPLVQEQRLRGQEFLHRHAHRCHDRPIQGHRHGLRLGVRVRCHRSLSERSNRACRHDPASTRSVRACRSVRLSGPRHSSGRQRQARAANRGLRRRKCPLRHRP
jgi:hypothetical protein